MEAVAGEEADIILSLPPQMPCSCNFNPWRYGGVDGCDILLRLLDQAAPILSPRHGRLYLIHAALANPARVRAALNRSSRSWKTLKTMEKVLDPEELETLHPELYDYLVEAHRQGRALLEQRTGHYVYPVWFYEIRY